jgi:hypothetical protein
MRLTRKDFLFRAGAAVIPVSLAGAPLPGGAVESAAPLSSPFNVRQFGARGDGLANDLTEAHTAFQRGTAVGRQLLRQESNLLRS